MLLNIFSEEIKMSTILVLENDRNSFNQRAKDFSESQTSIKHKCPQNWRQHLNDHHLVLVVSHNSLKLDVNKI